MMLCGWALQSVPLISVIIVEWKLVDGGGIHGLNCRHSERRHRRHGTVDSIIHKALDTAKIPLQLEPAGLFRSDGKHPSGMNIVP